MYDLSLSRHIGTFRNIDLEKNVKIKEELEGINDFKDKLLYYNSNIESLALCPIGSPIIFEWGTPDQYLKIYCGCKNCRTSKKFDPEEEKIFLHLRMKEIERIVKLLADEHNYKRKLETFSQIKGFYFDNTPVIYSNIENETEDENIFESIVSVDLRPSTKEERIAYNTFIQSCFEKKYCLGDGFTKEYAGFDFSKEKQRLQQTLIKAIDGKNLLEHLIFKIDERFNYPDSLKAKENNSRIIKEIDTQLLSLGEFPNLFAKMVLGIEVDLNQIQLNEFALFNYTHISQIVKFYRFVKQPLQQILDSKETNDT